MFINGLLLFVPLSALLAYVFHAPPLAVFATAGLGIVPLAEWIRRATEQIAARSGSTIGGLLNVTFGNVSELIIALFVLAEGSHFVVKGQITGSIIGNGLLGLGMGALVGGWGRVKQSFSRDRAGLSASLLILAVIGLLLPAMFDLTERNSFKNRNPGPLNDRLSLGVSIVLVIVYLSYLAYTLITHREIFAAAEEEEAHPADWSLGKAIGVLLGATCLIALEAELVSGALESSAKSLGVSTFFLGVTVLAVIGNAAEYISAIYFARKDRMDLVVGITVGAVIQVALLIAPLLVIASFLMGKPMNLVFTTPLELIAIASVAFAINSIARDGETTWFEGLLLLGVYVIFAIAFFYVVP